MVHLLPHWTHPGKEGQTVPVWCYSNCDTVELFLNGELLGRQHRDDDLMRLEWLVPYEAGILEAFGIMDGDETPAAMTNQQTAGNPARIRFEVDKQSLQADGYDLAHITVRVEDQRGVLVPTADALITFECSGGVLRLDNGDPLDELSFNGSQKRAFRGLCIALVQADAPGKITLKARAAGLVPATATLWAHDLI